LTTITVKSPWVVALVVAGIVAYFLYLENTCLQVTKYEISCCNLPQDFDGFKIALVSDLHGNKFGDAQSGLVSAISEFEPDIIAIAGDLVDERDFTLAPALSLLEGIHGLAPAYYVCGNHEVCSGNLHSIQTQLERFGVHALRNQAISFTRGNSKLAVAGLDDPLNFETRFGQQKRHVGQILSQITSHVAGATFTILLSHRPEFIDTYAAHDISLVLSGHAHGGLVRLPGIGGLIAPGQGLMPRYTNGVYASGNTVMVVSRGLGNSGALQVRIFNRPELVLITLRANDELSFQTP